jgi:hypothetical protein
MRPATIPPASYRSGKTLMILIFYRCLVAASIGLLVWLVWNGVAAYQRGKVLEVKAISALEQGRLALASGDLMLLAIDFREIRTVDGRLVQAELAKMQQHVHTMQSKGVSLKETENFWKSYRNASRHLTAIQDAERTSATGLDLRLRFLQTGFSVARMSENAANQDELIQLNEIFEQIDDLIAGKDISDISEKELFRLASMAERASKELLTFSYNGLELRE